MFNPSTVLAGLPTGLRAELMTAYQAIARNHLEGRWEPAELNGGKFCEVVYSILSGALSGNFPSAASKPANMVEACKKLEAQPANASLVGDRSLRVLIPRLLPVLYEIRNNRGVGHVGGDVNPNKEDAEAVLNMATWVMAELIRIFHKVPIADAQAIVDALVERRHPLVWVVEADQKRVLDPKLSKGDQAMLLLYTEPSWVGVDLLNSWVEYSSVSMFRAKVLKPLHQRRDIEYDVKNSRVRISPVGVARVEKELLK